MEVLFSHGLTKSFRWSLLSARLQIALHTAGYPLHPCRRKQGKRQKAKFPNERVTNDE